MPSLGRWLFRGFLECIHTRLRTFSDQWKSGICPIACKKVKYYFKKIYYKNAAWNAITIKQPNKVSCKLREWIQAGISAHSKSHYFLAFLNFSRPYYPSGHSIWHHKSQREKQQQWKTITAAVLYYIATEINGEYLSESPRNTSKS